MGPNMDSALLNIQTLSQVFQIYCCCCSVTQLCLTFCDPMDWSMPGLLFPHHLPKFAQVHVHCIGDAIQPSHPQTPFNSSTSFFFFLLCLPFKLFCLQFPAVSLYCAKMWFYFSCLVFMLFLKSVILYFLPYLQSSQPLSLQILLLLHLVSHSFRIQVSNMLKLFMMIYVIFSLLSIFHLFIFN